MESTRFGWLLVASVLCLGEAGCDAASTRDGGAAATAVAIDVQPRDTSVGAGGTASFRATVTGTVDTAVTWEVIDASGGTIDATGHYQAPQAAGVYRVRATSAAVPSVQGTASVTVIVTQPPTTVPAVGVPLGVNISWVNDWDPTQMFADVMKHGRHFGTAAQPWAGGAAVDGNGWPTGDAGVTLMAGIPSSGGTYKLSLTGNATVAVANNTDAGTRVANRVYAAGSNTTTADVVVGPAENNLTLVFTGQAGGVKDVKLMRPGHGPGEVFNQQFLARLARFQAVRMMDYSSTNGNGQVNWADRMLPGNASQQVKPSGENVGGAWEYVVLLANQAGKDIWLNVPHQATDDYVTKLAQLLRYGSDGVNPYTSAQASPVYPPLAEGRKVYVEWSNELWNGGFPQSGWLGQQADAAIAAGDADLAYDGSTDHYVIMFRLVGRRTMQISNLFRGVFGDAAMMTRIRPILPAQTGNDGTLQTPLAYLAARHGGAANYVYAATGHAYVTVNDDVAGQRTGLTTDAIFGEMAPYNESLKGWVGLLANQTRAHGIKLLAYEGGQHLYGTGSQAAKLAAQTDARMRDVLVQNLANWKAAGGDLYFYYNLCSGWNQFGTWGLSNDISSEAGPKWQAIADIYAAWSAP